MKNKTAIVLPRLLYPIIHFNSQDAVAHFRLSPSLSCTYSYLEWELMGFKYNLGGWVEFGEIRSFLVIAIRIPGGEEGGREM